MHLTLLYIHVYSKMYVLLVQQQFIISSCVNSHKCMYFLGFLKFLSFGYYIYYKNIIITVLYGTGYNVQSSHSHENCD